jgi:hypothetical protein
LIYLRSVPFWIENRFRDRTVYWRLEWLLRNSRELFRLTDTVDLSAASGKLAAEWFNPSTGDILSGGTTTGGAKRTFKAPFRGDAVLYLAAREMPI